MSATRPPWRPPTRRAFVAMLGAAAAALAVGRPAPSRPVDPTPRDPATGLPIWIGHF